ncbi:MULTISPECIES: VOC family protein [Halomonas]|uniref:VOC family protein n=1 Tax=Halomonas halophila TaxID=29573 RepID=A0ABQ0U7S5_9GAMM|nr:MULTISPECIES: VOC family protein [Halomonas]MDR5889383.1 VOC family protein [Halomonas salina]WJY06069.1 VOC family protein [Halomonas halophila]GEK74490.1 VOC family protein [Halomonas halophila]
MSRITPCLWFDGQAIEAARFYVSVFPDSRIERVLEAPADTPSVPAGAALLVAFTLDGSRYLGLNGGPDVPFNEAVSLHVDCADQAEVDYYWEALSEGGLAIQCGWLQDRWGLRWQVVPRRMHELLHDPDPERARRAMEAMMQMEKLVIADLERAADGRGPTAS